MISNAAQTFPERYDDSQLYVVMMIKEQDRSKIRRHHRVLLNRVDLYHVFRVIKYSWIIISRTCERCHMNESCTQY